MRVFGSHLDTLVALRALVALAGVEALRRLARRLMGDEWLAAAVVSFLVTACFFLPWGSVAFPYSVAALEGAVGVWIALELALSSDGPGRRLAAAVVAGLAGT